MQYCNLKEIVWQQCISIYGADKRLHLLQYIS